MSDTKHTTLNLTLFILTVAQDVQMMIFVGFGFLMTFLRRFGYSAIFETLLIVVVTTEYAILVQGFARRSEIEDAIILLNWSNVMDASIAAITVLVSFGVILGKVTPTQLLVIALVETPVYAANTHLGYSVLGAVDAGGTIFIHTFGAYFGLCVSLVQRGRNYDDPDSAEVSESRYTSDLFSFLGTLVLWLFWPSFNGYAVFGDDRQRAWINTYIALAASTVTTIAVSMLSDVNRRINAVDLQNASLSGGVIVGSVAHLSLQPYGAILAGSLAGVVSTFGYRKVQPWLLAKLNVHDTCGVHNLHGVPGVLGGLLSVVMAAIAAEREYSAFSAIADGSRTPLKQAFEGQLVALAASLGLAVVTGIATGLLINIPGLCEQIADEDLFTDDVLFNLPDDDDEESVVASKPSSANSAPKNGQRLAFSIAYPSPSSAITVETRHPSEIAL